MINVIPKPEAVSVKHPGLVLKQAIAENKLTVKQAAAQIGVPIDELSSIVNQQSNINPLLAYRLATFFGTHARFWFNLACEYDWHTVVSIAQNKQLSQLEFPVLRAKRL